MRSSSPLSFLLKTPLTRRATSAGVGDRERYARPTPHETRRRKLTQSALPSLRAGVIVVNNQKSTPDCIIRNGDLISNVLHRYACLHRSLDDHEGPSADGSRVLPPATSHPWSLARSRSCTTVDCPGTMARLSSSRSLARCPCVADLSRPARSPHLADTLAFHVAGASDREVQLQHAARDPQVRLRPPARAQCAQCPPSFPSISSLAADPAHHAHAASNRLDRLTSGVMVCALTVAASKKLGAWFGGRRNHEGGVSKEYVARCIGRFPECVGRDDPLCRACTCL